MGPRTLPFLTFAVEPAASGHLDATVKVRPGDASPVVRLFDGTDDTVCAVSTRQGSTARLTCDVAPRAYVGQVFVAADRVCEATLTLNITYP